MKVKIFTENAESEGIEKEINNWIEKTNPNIKFIPTWRSPGPSA
ncbi:hypothetical protein [Desulfobacter vibrioformis]|nr:hypothetical protein [Desulfobacter vibrioformis]